MNAAPGRPERHSRDSASAGAVLEKRAALRTASLLLAVVTGGIGRCRSDGDVLPLVTVEDRALDDRVRHPEDDCATSP